MKTSLTFSAAIRLLLCGLAALVTGCPGTGDVGGGVAGLTVQVIPGTPDASMKPANADALVARVLALTNEERESRGLHPLMLNPTLCVMADEYCCEMIEGRFFGHQSHSGEGPGDRARRHGYVFLAIGENLAVGQTSPEQVMAEWMSSAGGHSQNILSHQWREIGLAVRTGGEHGIYWVQEFGNPAQPLILDRE